MRRKTEVIALLVIVTFVGCGGINDFNYCFITCKGALHTVCKFSAEESKNKCEERGFTNVSHGLTDEEKEIVVQYHNALRQKVASGHETRGLNRGQPAAKEMKTLQWDDELEYIAQRWVDQCTASKYKLKHDSCRSRANDEVVGQNAAIHWKSTDTSVMEPIMSWYSEVDDYDGINVFKPYGEAFCPKDKVIGHYTQLVNAETDKIGCGAARYTEGSSRVLYFICNYAPAGNYVNRLIYIPDTNIEDLLMNSSFANTSEFPQITDQPKLTSVQTSKTPSNDETIFDPEIIDKLQPGQPKIVNKDYDSDEGHVKETIIYTMKITGVKYIKVTKKEISKGGWRSTTTNTNTKTLTYS